MAGAGEDVYYPILKHYAELYEKKYGVVWRPQPQHWKQTKELMTPVEGFDTYTVEEVKARMDEYFRSILDWVVGCKNNYSAFVKHIDKFIPPAPKKAMQMRVENVECPYCHLVMPSGSWTEHLGNCEELVRN